MLKPISLYAQLTIDDGPYQFITTTILNILRKHDVKAIFFLIGMQADLWHETLDQIHSEGHLIGNHGYTHLPFTQLTEWQIRNELLKTEESLRYLNSSRLFRPPYGYHNQKTDSILKEMGYNILMWDVLIEKIQDIDKLPFDPIIVLAHQNQWLVEHLDTIILDLKKRQFRFVLNRQPKYL